MYVLHESKFIQGFFWYIILLTKSRIDAVITGTSKVLFLHKMFQMTSILFQNKVNSMSKIINN